MADIAIIRGRWWRQCGHEGFAGGVLRCQCANISRGPDLRRLCAQTCVRVHEVLEAQRARFSMVSVVPRDKSRWTKNGDKLKVVDSARSSSARM